jgi:hypothetical protein
VSIDVGSREFEPSLRVLDPLGTEIPVGTCENRYHPRVDFTCLHEGAYLFEIGTLQAGRKGDYRLSASFFGPEEETSVGDTVALPIEVPAGISGRLQPGDGRTDEGNYADRYLFYTRPGRPIAVDLASEQIDTYLCVETTSGPQRVNDDYSLDKGHSRVEIYPDRSEACTVTVTSYRPGEMGHYRLSIEDLSGPGTRQN